MSQPWRTQRPEPARFWIRHAPRVWPAPDALWLDLARGRLGAAALVGGPADLSALSGAVLDDVVYLPPVAPELAAERDRLARTHLARGTPVLVQLLVGERTDAAGATVVVDPLAALGVGGEPDLGGVPPSSGVVWPLVAGISDRTDAWRRAAERLAAAGAAWLQGLAPHLDPEDRRRLATDEATFDALFHRDAPAERDFARAAARAGFGPLAPRPFPRAPILLADNRRIAGRLAECAELWLRLGRPAEAGQALFRAARFVDETRYDVAALARDGHLGVIEALSDAARQLIEELSSGRQPALLGELVAAYCAGDGA